MTEAMSGEGKTHASLISLSLTTRSQLTPRAVIIGLFVGTLMCFTNMYFGLLTGWVTMGSIQSALLGFGICRMFEKLQIPGFLEPLTPLENVVIQTTSVATATMPLAGGFVGVVPALALLDEKEGRMNLTIAQNLLWALSITFFGLFCAVPLRRQTILVENLRFPSGTATAQLIEVLHCGTTRTDPTQRQALRRQWGVLGIAFSVSAGYSLLAYFVPVFKNMPVFTWLGYPALTEFNWTFNPALAFVGQGMIMGVRAGISALAGSILGWAILGPMAKHYGWAPGKVSDWRTGAQGWILWIALIVMLCESCVALSITAMQVARSYYHYYTGVIDVDAVKDPASEDEQIPRQWWIWGLLISALVCIAIDAPLFHMPVWQVLLAVALGCVVSLVGVRALGDTDLNPVSGIGKVSQVIFGMVDSHAMVGNIVGGGIAEAGAQQAGDMIQDLKTGHLLGGSPKAQFFAQLIGSAASIFTAVLAYELYKIAYGIPYKTKPPSAEIWLNMARLAKDGTESLAPHVEYFAVTFGLLAASLPIIAFFCPNWKPYLPSATAFAIGMYIQPYWVIPRVVGAFITYAADRQYAQQRALKKRQSEDSPLLNDGDANEEDDDDTVAPLDRHDHSTTVIIVASGFVLGDGIMSIATAALKAFNVSPFSCIGCPVGFCQGCP